MTNTDEKTQNQTKTKPRNQLAFPRPYSARRREDNICFRVEDGMTLRDYFAAAALQGYAANERVMNNAIEDWKESGGRRPICPADYLAGLAYEVADAMLKARDK